MSGKGFIAVEEKDLCEFCKRKEELRPYGPKGERVCFECAMKDEEAAGHQFSHHVLGESIN